MKTALVICQYRENYGACDWNGEGDCPQYWKNKGGIDHLFTNVPDCWTTGQVDDAVRSKVQHSNNFSSSSIIHIEFVENGHVTQYEKDQLEHEGRIIFPADRTDITTLTTATEQERDTAP